MKSPLRLVLLASFAMLSLSRAGAEGFSFSLLPKSFQKNPKLDCNVFTELTAEGKKRALPTAEKPEYYISQITRAQSRGVAVLDTGHNMLTMDQVQELVVKALEPNHYLPATDGTPKPTLVLLIHWGTYSSPAFNVSDGDTSFAEDAGTPQELLPKVLADTQKRKALIDRAAMVGGVAFATELNDVLNREVAMRAAANSADTGRAQALEASTGSSTDSASLLSSMLESTSPLAMFMRRDSRTEQMVDEVFSDCYYVIVSAVDYTSLAANKPQLLWRTKLTLNSVGVNMRESMPPLVKAGTDYFGKETTTPVVITRRISREGKVEIGETQVKETFESPASDKASPPAPEHKK